MVVGESVREYAELVAAANGRIIAAPEQSLMPRAAAVGMLAFSRWQLGLAIPPVELNPLYVRRAEAEELWERRCQERT